MVDGVAQRTHRPVTDVAPGEVDLEVVFTPPAGQKLDDRYGPATRLVVSATPPGLLKEGDGTGTDLTRRLTLDAHVGDGVLHVAARAASCDDARRTASSSRRATCTSRTGACRSGIVEGAPADPRAAPRRLIRRPRGPSPVRATLAGMYETATSSGGSTTCWRRPCVGSSEHLRSIVTEGERTLDAAQTAAVLTGMRTLAVSTVTAAGEPRVSGEDGHFLHARWVFTTSGDRGQGQAPPGPAGGVGSAHRRRRPRHLLPRAGRVHRPGHAPGLPGDRGAPGRRTTARARAAGAPTSSTCGCSRTGWCPTRSRRTACSPSVRLSPATARGPSAAAGSRRRSRAGARRSRTTRRCGRRRRAPAAGGRFGPRGRCITTCITSSSTPAQMRIRPRSSTSTYSSIRRARRRRTRCTPPTAISTTAVPTEGAGRSGGCRMRTVLYGRRRSGRTTEAGGPRRAAPVQRAF